MSFGETPEEQGDETIFQSGQLLNYCAVLAKSYGRDILMRKLEAVQPALFETERLRHEVRTVLANLVTSSDMDAVIASAEADFTELHTRLVKERIEARFVNDETELLKAIYLEELKLSAQNTTADVASKANKFVYAHIKGIGIARAILKKDSLIVFDDEDETDDQSD